MSFSLFQQTQRKFLSPIYEQSATCPLDLQSSGWKVRHQSLVSLSCGEYFSQSPQVILLTTLHWAQSSSSLGAQTYLGRGISFPNSHESSILFPLVLSVWVSPVGGHLSCEGSLLGRAGMQETWVWHKPWKRLPLTLTTEPPKLT